MKLRAITGYTTPDKNVETVDVVTMVCTGGHDGNGEPGTEELCVVRTQYGDLALCRASNAYLNKVDPLLITYVQGAKTPKELAKLLIILAKQLNAQEEN